MLDWTAGTLPVYGNSDDKMHRVSLSLSLSVFFLSIFSISFLFLFFSLFTDPVSFHRVCFFPIDFWFFLFLVSRFVWSILESRIVMFLLIDFRVSRHVFLLIDFSGFCIMFFFLFESVLGFHVMYFSSDLFRISFIVFLTCFFSSAGLRTVVLPWRFTSLTKPRSRDLSSFLRFSLLHIPCCSLFSVAFSLLLCLQTLAVLFCCGCIFFCFASHYLFYISLFSFVYLAICSFLFLLWFFSLFSSSRSTFTFLSHSFVVCLVAFFPFPDLESWYLTYLAMPYQM